jgi:hypothetical protein
MTVDPTLVLIGAACSLISLAWDSWTLRRYRRTFRELLANCGCHEYTNSPCANCERIEALGFDP